ncbi:beta strand repeat-containing protein [Galbibacter mesophilus]|uniref:beta strand repeat-containing protein n=1 Tax=Galbibacter mesophilus TaxID=379069 RepID=UPI0020436FC6|nr:hypothetical protein [Galbibacter mesophilus]MCM5661358.1 hypothetical protein [Galbibacter mesophilus]
MRKGLLFKGLFVFSMMTMYSGFSQVGIGTSIPDGSAQLDVVASDRGVLIPRVALSSITDVTTITNGNVNSLLVFNITNSTNIKPGYYYWSNNDKRWMRILNTSDVVGGNTPDNVVIYNPLTNNFTYVDANGDEQNITIEEVVRSNETLTTLINNNDGTYTYTSEDGTPTIIDVPADVINNFEEIVQDPNVVNQITNVFENTEIGGNVKYDGDSFTYVDEDGNNQTIDIEDIVRSNETLTTLINNNDGTYTYNSEDGTVTVINVPADVINNFEEIAQDADVINEITKIVNDNGQGGNVSYDGTDFTYVDGNGDEQTIDMAQTVKDNETLTTLTETATGSATYIYTSEDGTTTTINVAADVINKADEIFNNTDVINKVTEIVNNNGQGGNVSYDGTDFTYVDGNGDEQTIDIAQTVKDNETLTTLTETATGSATYVYTSEDGTTTTINVAADVINKAEEIFNNTDVINKVTEIVNNNGQGGNVSYDGTDFTYVDGNGDEQTIDIAQTVKDNETLTTLTETPSGSATYIYTSEDGTTTTINVAADVINKAEEIFNNTDVINKVTEIVNNNGQGGNVSYDGTDFSYVDENGDEQTIDIAQTVKDNETLTTLTETATGSATYIYTSEDGTTTTINVAADVINKAEEIFNNTDVINKVTEIVNNNGQGGNVSYDGTDFSYVDENGDEQTIDIAQTVKDNETLTTLTETPSGSATYIYTSEDGTTTTINVAADVINKADEIFNNTDVINKVTEIVNNNGQGGNVSYDGTDFIYVDENGDEQTIDMSQLVKDNETLTTLINNNDGTYTYNSEDGTPTIIDVPADVINNFEEIAQDADVINEITKIVNDNGQGGNVSYDGTDFTYVDGNGDEQTIDMSQLVKDNETLTTLINNNDGTYTYNSEDGTVTVINVPADVINNFEEIAQDADVINEITKIVNDNGQGGNVSYDGTDFTYVDGNGDEQTIDIAQTVKDNETLTTLTETATGSATYIYTSEDGTTTTINVAADVINKADEIFNNTDVINEITEIVNNNGQGGNVSYDGTDFTYVDGNGDEQTIDIAQTVKDNETLTTLTETPSGSATYIYTSEDGTTTTINVAADVINNFEEIAQDADVINEITKIVNDNGQGGNVSYDGTDFTYVDGNGDEQTIDIAQTVKDNETLTTLTETPSGSATYIYTSEDGTTTTINVAADVINNFEEIAQDADVINEITKIVNDNGQGGNVSYDGTDFTYVDGNGDEQTIDIAQTVKDNETLTTLTETPSGSATYIYTSEDGTTTTINVAADVINKADEIFNNTDVINEITEIVNNNGQGGNVSYDGTDFTYVDGNGDEQTIDMSQLVKDNETLTTLIENTDGTYTYTSEDGTATIISLPDVEEGGNVSYDGTTEELTYVDENGDTQTLPIDELVKANETVTTLVNNTDGTYTYNSEDGTVTVINVPADVINNFEEIAQDADVINEITKIVNDNGQGGNVSYDGTDFTYVDGNGDEQTIDMSQLVKDNETVTTLVNNTDGTYTYNSEDGTVTVINVPADVINNFEEIAQDADVINEITKIVNDNGQGGNVSYDGTDFTYVDGNGDEQTIDMSQLVKDNETVTTLIDNNDGTYTYTSEDGTPTTISLPNVEEGGNVSYDGTTEEFTYVDGNGDEQTIDMDQLVKDNETTTSLTQDNDTGVIRYTDEDGLFHHADVVSVSTDNILTVGADGGAKLTQDDVKNNETVTSLSQDNASGVISYTDEAGASVSAEVVSAESANILTVGIDGGALLTQADVRNNETVTEFEQDNGTGVITYKDEEGSLLEANVVSEATDNIITVGSDGGAKLTQADISNNETESTLIQHPDSGGYIYTSEKGNSQEIVFDSKNLIGGLIGSSYLQGTDRLVVNQGETKNIPGLALTINVPEGQMHTVQFTVQSYVVLSVSSNGSGQGVIGLYQNDVKISSAYLSVGAARNNLSNLPSPVTFLKSVDLTEGSYTFILKVSSWYNNLAVNHVPTNYLGFDGDNEALLTKMSINIFRKL